MYYVGLDVSITSSGYSVFAEDGSLLVADVVKSSSKDPDLFRFRKIAQEIQKSIRKFVAHGEHIFYVLEDYSFRSSGQITRLAENIGILKVELYNIFGATPNVCSVATLKKFVAGKGAGKGKGPVMVGVYKKWGFETKYDDIADAYGLGKIARELHYWTMHKECRDYLLQYEKECIETVRKRNNYLKK